MIVKDYECKQCGSRDFIFKAKDEHITGIYCSNCGRWLKWADKKEKILAKQSGLTEFQKVKKSELKNLYDMAVRVSNEENLDEDIRETLIDLTVRLKDRV